MQQCYPNDNVTKLRGLRRASELYSTAAIDCSKSRTVNFNGKLISLYHIDYAVGGMPMRRALVLVPYNCTSTTLVIGHHASNSHAESLGAGNLIDNPEQGAGFEDRWLVRLVADKGCVGLAADSPKDSPTRFDVNDMHTCLLSDVCAYLAYVQCLPYGLSLAEPQKIIVAGGSWGAQRSIFVSLYLKHMLNKPVAATYLAGAQVDASMGGNTLTVPPEIRYGVNGDLGNFYDIMLALPKKLRLHYGANDTLWSQFATNKAEAQRIASNHSNAALGIKPNSGHFFDYADMANFYDTV